MTADVLLGEFDRICEAPGAIPRLRRFILDLAVRGKLVPQDPSDEPATELLKRIAAERHRRTNVREGIKSDASEAADLAEAPFSLPPGWEVARMGWLASKLGAGSTPLGGKSVYQTDGVPFIRSQNVYNDGLRLDDVARISRTIHDKMSGTHVKHNDILLNITGASIGRSSLVPESLDEGNVSQHVAIIRLFEPEIRHFIHLSLTSPLYQKAIDDAEVGVSREGLSMQRLRQFPMVLPPLAEQHRIVAKVDELMALCDQLEGARNAREEYRDKLVAANLQRLGQPAGDAAGDRDHARFSLDHLASLTARLEHIKQLRQAILNLAVRGKLVQQDPREEPGSELLRQILVHKNEDIGGNNGSTHENFDATRSGELPVTLPSGWIWSTFGAIMISRDSERVPISKDERSRRAKLYDYYGASGVIDKIDGYLFDEPLLLIGEDGANLINRSSPIAFIARGKYWVNNHAHVLGAISEDLLRYIELHINAIDLKPYVTGTAQPKMNQAKMNSIPIALPPLAEQRRIVAKVDELNALCDHLEAQLVTTETESRRLLDAALHEALVREA